MTIKRSSDPCIILVGWAKCALRWLQPQRHSENWIIVLFIFLDHVAPSRNVVVGSDWIVSSTEFLFAQSLKKGKLLIQEKGRIKELTLTFQSATFVNACYDQICWAGKKINECSTLILVHQILSWKSGLAEVFCWAGLSS